MLISANLLPIWLHACATLAMVAALVAAARFADWPALARVKARQHVLFGATLALVGLWLMTVRLIEGIYLHLGLMTAMTLIVGLRFTLLAGAIVVLAHTLVQGEDWLSIPLAFCLSVAIPAITTRLLVHGLRRSGVRNLFMFMLGGGFAGGALSVLVTALVVAGLLAASGYDRLLADAARSWAFIFLVMFPEGFINGLIVTALTVFWPEIVKTFDEGFYLDGDDPGR